MNGICTNAVRSWRRVVGAVSASLLLLTLAPSAQAGPMTPALIKHYQQEVALNPKSPDAHLDLAMAYCRTVWVESCYFELVKINQLDPGYIDKVLKRYSEAVQRHPNDIEAHFRLSFAYFFKDQGSRRSIEEQEKILALDPRYVWSYNYLSFLAYFVEHDLSKAMKLAHRAAELDPNNAISHFLLGQGYIKAGKLRDGATEMALSARLRADYKM